MVWSARLAWDSVQAPGFFFADAFRHQGPRTGGQFQRR
jgi:hypothetical protein